MASLNDDPSYIGGEVSRFLIPAGWKFEGKVVWDFASTFPAQTHWRVSAPDGASAFENYPALLFYWDTNRNGIGFHPPVGSKYAGGIVEQPPKDVFAALQQYVLPAYRKDLLKARVVGTERLDKLAQYVHEHSFVLQGQTQQVMAGRVRFEYVVNGQPIEEDFIAAMSVIPSQFHTVDWRVVQLRSTRAPKGALDDVKSDRLVMERSIQPSLAWYNKLYQFSADANRARLAEIQATAERSRIFAQMTNEVNESRKQSFEKHIHDIGEQALVVDQYIRDVTPYNTTQGPPVELPSAYNHAWQGANGQYIMSNNPNYDPNTDPTSTQSGWVLLNRTR